MSLQRHYDTNTAIVGLVRDGVVYLGGDSLGVCTSTFGCVARNDSKVFEVGPYVFGFCGSFRAGQLLRYKFKEPDHDPRTPVDKFMVDDFVDAIRKTFKDGGVAKKNDDRESHNAPFLVGYQGRLFCVESDYQVAEARVPYMAAGCAEDIALGAFHAWSRSKHWDEMAPAAILHQVLEACAMYSAAVRPPFVIVAGGAKNAED